MKELFENWRKYTKILNESKETEEQVKIAQDRVKQATEQAASIVNTAKKELEIAQKKDQADKAAASLEKKQHTGMSTTKSTTGTQPPIMEEDVVDETVGFQGNQEGTPVSVHEDDSCDIYEGYTDEGNMCELEMEEVEENQRCGSCEGCMQENILNEAEYRGRKVKLGKKMKGDVKKYKVYVRNDKGNVVKVNFGDPNMEIKRDDPERRKSFRARHNCDNPGPRWKPRYWACRTW